MLHYLHPMVMESGDEEIQTLYVEFLDSADKQSKAMNQTSFDIRASLFEDMDTIESNMQQFLGHFNEWAKANLDAYTALLQNVNLVPAEYSKAYGTLFSQLQVTLVDVRGKAEKAISQGEKLKTADADKMQRLLEVAFKLRTEFVQLQPENHPLNAKFNQILLTETTLYAEMMFHF